MMFILFRNYSASIIELIDNFLGRFWGRGTALTERENLGNGDSFFLYLGTVHRMEDEQRNIAGPTHKAVVPIEKVCQTRW